MYNFNYHFLSFETWKNDAICNTILAMQWDWQEITHREIQLGSQWFPCFFSSISRLLTSMKGYNPYIPIKPPYYPSEPL